MELTQVSVHDPWFVRSKVKSVLVDGEDVTWRCTAADAEEGWADVFKVEWMTDVERHVRLRDLGSLSSTVTEEVTPIGQRGDSVVEVERTTVLRFTPALRAPVMDGRTAYYVVEGPPPRIGRERLTGNVEIVT